MKKSLTSKERLLVGSLMFGLFFGAGNLIFPIELGQNSGSNLYQATGGFLISAVGLPILGIIASCLADATNLFEMCQKKVSRGYAFFFTIALYLTIGPFFAIPRTATTSFEVGFSRFIPEEKIGLYLLIFSAIFFALVLFFSLRPSKLIDNIGKFMTPIFLVLLAIIVILSIVKPMGPRGSLPPTKTYQTAPLMVGFLDGYNTMDALASLAFAIIITSNLKNLGVEDGPTAAKEASKSGLVCLIAMSIVYGSMSLMSSSSLNIMERGDNGGVILSKISEHYLGRGGDILVAAIVIFACMKTSIGLIASCSEIFVSMFPNSLSYNKYAVLFTIISFLISNLGLSKIISLSVPVLMYLYPLAIVLIILGLFTSKLGKYERLNHFAIYFTAIFAILDFLNAIKGMVGSRTIENIVAFSKAHLPFFKLGLGRILPFLIGGLIGFILDRSKATSK